MDVTKVVANFRLKYHLNAIDAINVANQLHILGDAKADCANKHHLKKCLDCYERLGLKLPKEFKDFKNEK